MADSPEVSSKAILAFVQDFLSIQDSSRDFSALDVSTDLVSYGIESILLLTLLSEIESKYSLSVSLDRLERHNFIFSVNTLLDISDKTA